MLTADESEQPREESRRGRGRPTLSNEELLERALDLFLVNGFDGTTVDAVTAAAGVAKRTVYKRYGDKMSLFKAALKHAIDKWIVPVERLRAAECEDLEETLLELGRILVFNMMSPEGLRLLRITNVESARLPELGEYTFREGTGPTIAYLADLFGRHAAKNGANLTEPEIAAEAFISLVISGPAERAAWGAAIDEIALYRRTRLCVRLFLHGLFPILRALRDSAQPISEDPSLEGELSSPAVQVPTIPESYQLQQLQDENRQLREMLVNSMLETRSLRQQLAGPEPSRSLRS